MPLRFITCIAIAFSLAASSAARAEDPATLFASAATAYEQGDHQAAYDTWLSLVEDHGVAADLFYNLGNASHRLGNPGEAALWYQRALVLEPRHAESRQNLRVIEHEVGFMKLEWNALQNFADTFTRRQLIAIATLGFWSVALSLAAGFYFTRPRLHPGYVTMRVLGLVLLAFAITTILVRRDPETLHNRSIITAASTARTAPADDSKEVISLPPGTQVDRIAERASWSYLEIPGELRGWIHTSEAAPLWPYDGSFLR